jgi:hypothetical protein
MRTLRTCGHLLTAALLTITSAAAQIPDPTETAVTPYAPGTRYDPAIPTLEQVTGHQSGMAISTHADVKAYLSALASASDTVRIIRFGESWQGRELIYAVVARPERIAGLEQIQAGMQQLADPRALDAATEQRLLDELPATGWLANCVHGDEPSGTDAALMVLYHLVAARGDAVVDRILDESVVIVDPLQNPDGRDRFVFYTRAARGRWADPTPDSAEHSQPWPTGRSNHALFDMNRDWFAQTQPESQARIAAFMSHWPQVYVDLHEMGGNSTYYFAPPAEPVNSEVTTTQRKWLTRYGRNNAKAFDQHGFEYFTREAYDSFYPGYGDSWPTFHGSVGMTFEMASSRGIVYRKRDGRLLRYRDGVHRHFVSSMRTLQTLAENRREALESFVAHRKAGVARGVDGPIAEFVFPPSGDRTRLARLMNLLISQGIEVHQATGPYKVEAASPLGTDDPTERTFLPGTFTISMAQPASTLAHVLLEPHFDMTAEFVAEQRIRASRREGTQFYDLTAWSLPLLFGVETWQTNRPGTGPRQLLAVGGATSGAAPLRKAPPKVAYLIPWGSNGAAALAVDLLRRSVRIRSLDRSFRLGGVDFPAGSLVVRVNDQPEGLHARMAELSAAHGVEVHSADSSWVESGPDLGSGDSHVLEVPRIAMLWDRPVNTYSAGWARYLLERRYGLPVSVLRTRDAARSDLGRFTTLIVPEGSGYSDVLGRRGIDNIRTFVDKGGVLVTLGRATRWLMAEDVDLLASKAEDRQPPVDNADPEPEEENTKDEAFDYQAAIRPDKERPPTVPGAILRVCVDDRHWLGFGYTGHANVVHDSSNIITPIKLDRGTNVAVYAEGEQLVQAGFVWDESRTQLPNKAYLLHQSRGDGHIVAFAEDPNVRAFADGLNLMLLNAVVMTAGR